MLVLHDVAPETWRDYQPLVEAVDALGHIPMSWLVVPDFHHRNPLDKFPGFCRMLDQRIACGDELVLHGYFHCDDGPGPRTLPDWFMRRIYTHEGEFYVLNETAALERLELGKALFQRHDWPLQGFVAPAWLLNEGARQALIKSGLSYTSDPHHLHLLPKFTAIKAPSFVWSARSNWRRGLSWLLSENLAWRCRQMPLVRLGLHPVDMRHDFSRTYWLELLQRLLADGRRPMTKSAWLRQYLEQPRSAA